VSDIPPVPTAKQIAKHVDRRQLRRKLVLVALLVAAIVAAILYGTCGRGWGLGGDGPGSGGGGDHPAVVDAGVAQCELRLAPDGITIDGAKVTRDKAIEVCKPAGRAVVTVTNTTVQGDWDDLRTALEAAGIKVFRQAK
jgi:hypothetical protein